MKTDYDVIKRPLRTEKTTEMEDNLNQVVFEVDRHANKIEVRQAIERLFGVSVVSVNTLNHRGKPKRVGKIFGRRSDTKKAIVTLKDDDHIEFFEEA